jgi:beta-lactamase regulating signal transducer with metallopeptidase domain
VIARSVLEACTPAQVRAIVAHERHHVDRRDNLCRALLSAAPDPIAWLPWSSRLLAAWHDASEDAADDAAELSGSDGRLHLAEALLRVARLAPETPWDASLPASALYRGDGLDRRVRRLVAPRQARETASAAWLPAALACGAAALFGVETVHRLIETAVTRLP